MKVDMSKAKQWLAIRRKGCKEFIDDLYPEHDAGRMTDSQRAVIAIFAAIVMFVPTLFIDAPTLENSSLEYVAFSNTLRRLCQLPFAGLTFLFAWKLFKEIRSFLSCVARKN